jgi:predicted small secreted protein
MKRTPILAVVSIVLAIAVVLGGCATTQQAGEPLPVEDVEAVDLTVSGEIGRSIAIPGTDAVVSYFSQERIEVPLVTDTVRPQGESVTIPVSVVPYDGAVLEETDGSVQAAVEEGLVALGVAGEDNAESAASTVMGYVRTFVIGRSADYFLVEQPTSE